jgi:hypothetical protein
MQITHSRHAVIAGVFEREDDKHEQRARNKLREKLAGFGDKCLRVRAEYASGGFWCWRHCPNAVPAFKPVYCTYGIRIYDPRAYKTTEKLGEEIDREASPGQLAEETVGESDRGIEISTRVAGHVDTQHYSETPSGTVSISSKL